MWVTPVQTKLGPFKAHDRKKRKKKKGGPTHQPHVFLSSSMLHACLPHGPTSMPIYWAHFLYDTHHRETAGKPKIKKNKKRKEEKLKFELWL